MKTMKPAILTDCTHFTPTARGALFYTLHHCAECGRGIQGANPVNTVGGRTQTALKARGWGMVEGAHEEGTYDPDHDREVCYGCLSER